MNILKKSTFFLALIIICCCFTTTFAQSRHHHDRHHHDRHHQDKKNWKHFRKNKHAYVKYKHPKKHDHRYSTPHWARVHHYQARHHVYFRDYCTFYDPYRGGYVYWHNRRWVFSRNVPSFLAQVDLGSARIQLMTDIPLNRHPEYYFDNYARSYPRNARIHVGIDLPL